MKKTYFIIAVLMGIQTLAVAQTPHPIDTIFNREPTYFYDSLWHDSADYYIPMSERTCEYHNGCAGAYIETGKYFHTDSTLLIVGVAVSIKTELNPFSAPNSRVLIDGEMRYLPTDSSFDNWYEYLRLYEPCDTGLVMLAQGTFNAIDTARRMRLFSHKQCDWYSPGYDTMVYSRYVPIYEVYFDKPVTMTGTFVVSVTDHNDILDRQSYSFPGLGARPIGISSYTFRDPFPVPCDHHHIRTVECSLLRNWTRFVCDGDAPYDVVIFPIIDTVQPLKCEAVTEMSVYQDSAAAIVSWSRGQYNLGWQVAYGPASEDPEGYAVVAATSEAYALRGLTPGEEYAVRVRANCFSDTTYSDWSDTLHFTRPTATQGITPAASLAPHVCLSPNPAHGKVSVCSAFALRRITLYDMQGRPALDTDAQGLTATLDVSALPKGTYLVGILTAHGHCTQRLVVE